MAQTARRSSVRTEWNRIINGRRYWFSRLEDDTRILIRVQRHFPGSDGRITIHRWWISK